MNMTNMVDKGLISLIHIFKSFNLNIHKRHENPIPEWVNDSKSLASGGKNANHIKTLNLIKNVLKMQNKIEQYKFP